MVFLRYMPVLMVFLWAPWTMTGAAAGEIFKWVAPDGTTHYSQYPPLADDTPVETLFIEPSNPVDWDPNEYRYSVMNQAKRTEERIAATRAAQEEDEPASDLPLRGQPPESDDYDPYQDRYPVYYNPWLPGHPFDSHGVFPRKHHPIPLRPPKKGPAHRFDFGDRFAHPARSHRRLGADKRFGYLGHRVTHRQRRDEDW